MHKKKHLNREDDGFAAIIVTLVIMTIIVLVVIGFFAVVNREQRATIDRQLSTQAFYAAETGVNDAAKALVNENLAEIETCSEFQGSGMYAEEHRFLSDDQEIEYTCVLVDKTPSSLAYDSISTDSPKVIIIKAVDESGNSVTLDSLNVRWESEDQPDNISFPSSGSDFPDDWNNPPPDGDPYAAPVLRMSLTPIDASGSVSRDQMIDQTSTIFLRPEEGAGDSSHNLNFGNQQNQGDIVRTMCSESADQEDCSISLGTGGAGSSEFLLTLRAVYHNASVFITGVDSGDNELLFADQQAIIDSTGRASDVLRRVQVRVPLQDQYSRPGFTLETGDGGGICKQYSVYPDTGYNTGGSACRD